MGRLVWFVVWDTAHTSSLSVTPATSVRPQLSRYLQLMIFEQTTYLMRWVSQVSYAVVESQDKHSAIVANVRNSFVARLTLRSTPSHVCPASIPRLKKSMPWLCSATN